MRLKTSRLFAVVAGLVISITGSAFIAKSVGAVTLVNEKVKVSENTEWGLGVSPAKLFFTLDPGSHYNGSYRVFNEGKNAFSFVIIVTPAFYTSDYSGYDFASKSKWNDILDWVDIETGPIHIEPGQMLEVPFTVDVPAKALGRSQFFALINRIVPDDSQNGGVVNAVKQIGLVASATIEAPGMELCGKIVDQWASWWQQEAPLQTFAKIENCGNVDFYAAGKVTIENALFGGGLVYEGAPEQLYLMPESERKFALDWADAPLFGIFKATQQVQVFDDVQIFEKTIIICPFWLVLMVVLAIALIVLAIVYSVTRRKNLKKGKRY